VSKKFWLLNWAIENFQFLFKTFFVISQKKFGHCPKMFSFLMDEGSISTIDLRIKNF
jgi:hypothetical protein